MWRRDDSVIAFPYHGFLRIIKFANVLKND